MTRTVVRPALALLATVFTVAATIVVSVATAVTTMIAARWPSPRRR